MAFYKQYEHFNNIPNNIFNKSISKNFEIALHITFFEQFKTIIQAYNNNNIETIIEDIKIDFIDNIKIRFILSYDYIKLIYNQFIDVNFKQNNKQIMDLLNDFMNNSVLTSHTILMVIINMFNKQNDKKTYENHINSLFNIKDFNMITDIEFKTILPQFINKNIITNCINKIQPIDINNISDDDKHKYITSIINCLLTPNNINLINNTINNNIKLLQNKLPNNKLTTQFINYIKLIFLVAAIDDIDKNAEAIGYNFHEIETFQNTYNYNKLFIFILISTFIFIIYQKYKK